MKVFRKNLLALALVDSGNLSTTLISEDFFKKLNLPLLSSNISLRSPNNRNDIKVLGATPPFSIFIEHVTRPLELEALVVKDLTYPLNLGRLFLEEHRAVLDYSQMPGSLILNGERASLVSKTTPLRKLSIDCRFQKLQRSLNENVNNKEDRFMFPVNQVDEFTPLSSPAEVVPPSSRLGKPRKSPVIAPLPPPVVLKDNGESQTVRERERRILQLHREREIYTRFPRAESANRRPRTPQRGVVEVLYNMEGLK